MGSGPRSGPFDTAGPEEIVVDGVTFRRGEKAILRPSGRADALDQILEGRTATIERIFLDLEDRIYLAVTVDDDPGQELMRESGRFLYFFPDELEVPAA